MNETLIQRIRVIAEEKPDKIAVAFKTEQLTYSELNKRISKIAARICEFGIERGDRVLFSAVSKPEMVMMYLAIQFVGAVAVFVDKNSTQQNAINIFEDAQAKMFFTDKPMEVASKNITTYSLRKACTESTNKTVCYEIPKEDSLAELIYTSGTTGKPKGCMLTYKAINSIWENTVRGIGMKENDVILIPLPLNHSFALRVLRAGLSIGATVVLQNGFTFAKEIENNIEAYACTAIAIVPASVETVARQMQDRFFEIMGRFRYIEVSAGSLPINLRKNLTEKLPNTIIHNTWGSSESGGAIFLNVSEITKKYPEKIDALGKPLDNVAVKGVDEKGREIPIDNIHPGIMAIHGDMQMVGYWNKPEMTKKTIRDGWLITGDLVCRDEDGFYYMLGRADDIINVGGEKVSPVEVETVAMEYERVSECACVGVDDPNGILGSVPILYVVSKDSRFSENELRQIMSGKLEKYKQPFRVIEVLELPRNNMQKVDKNKLKAMWERHDVLPIVNETMQTIMTRRSIRKFTEKRIEREILESIVNAGYYAPSGHNMQTWQFTVITETSEIKRLKDISKKTAEDNDVYFFGWENPVAIILISNDKRNPYGCQDASCAAENIMLAAWSYGIGSVWLNPLMTLREKSPIKETLDGYNIPKNHIVWSAIAMGYPITEGALLKKKADVINWID